MEHTTLPRDNSEISPHFVKRLGLGVLGVIGLVYGTNAGLNSLLMPGLPLPLRPVALGVGAALHYGGYQALKHRYETTYNAQPGQEARIQRVGRYAGGAALMWTGFALTGVAPLVASGAAVAGVWAGGLLASGVGLYQMDRSFELVPQATPDTLKDRVTDMFSALQDRLYDLRAGRGTPRGAHT